MAEVGSVTLVCPTMGIDDPTTTWFRIITSSEVNVTNDGRQMQVPVDENDPRITIRYDSGSNVAMAIHQSE